MRSSKNHGSFSRNLSLIDFRNINITPFRQEHGFHARTNRPDARRKGLPDSQARLKIRRSCLPDSYIIADLSPAGQEAGRRVFQNRDIVSEPQYFSENQSLGT